MIRLPETVDLFPNCLSEQRRWVPPVFLGTCGNYYKG